MSRPLGGACIQDQYVAAGTCWASRSGKAAWGGELFAACRAGTVAVLLGSTEKMGVRRVLAAVERPLVLPDHDRVPSGDSHAGEQHLRTCRDHRQR